MKQQTEANTSKPSIPPPPLVPSGATSGTPTKQEHSQLSNGMQLCNNNYIILLKYH